MAVLIHPNIFYLHCLGDNPGGTEFFLDIDRLETDHGQQIDLWKKEEEKLPLSKIAMADKRKKAESSIVVTIQIAYEIASAISYLHGNE